MTKIRETILLNISILFFILNSTGCSTSSILKEYSLIKDKPLSQIDTKSSKTVVRPFEEEQKFHFGINISEQFLNKTIAELMKNGALASKFEKPITVKVPPFDHTIKMIPSIGIDSLNLSFSSACTNCILIETKISGKFNLSYDNENKSISSNLYQNTFFSVGLKLNGKIVTRESKEKNTNSTSKTTESMLALQLEPVSDNDIQISTKIPVPGIDSVLTSLLKSNMQIALQNKSLNTFDLWKIPDFKLEGSQVRPIEIGYQLLRTPRGELFLGANFNLEVPKFSLTNRLIKIPKNHDISISIPEEVLSSLINIWSAEGILPSRYTTDGVPDVNGPLAMELKKIVFFEDYYSADIRIWHLKKPFFWREYLIKGNISVKRDDIIFKNESAKLLSQEGPNLFVDMILGIQNKSFPATLENLVKKVPRNIELPLNTSSSNSNSNTIKGEISFSEIQTDNHQLSIYSDINLKVRSSK